VKAGLAWLAGGIAMLALGIYVTRTSRHVIMFGAFLVGLLWIARGIVRIVEARKTNRQ
jgi:uncharacterized membrane protein HdeD (DUF308 family)